MMPCLDDCDAGAILSRGWGCYGVELVSVGGHGLKGEVLGSGFNVMGFPPLSSPWNHVRGAGVEGFLHLSPVSWAII